MSEEEVLFDLSEKVKGMRLMCSHGISPYQSAEGSDLSNINVADIVLYAIEQLEGSPAHLYGFIFNEEDPQPFAVVLGDKPETFDEVLVVWDFHGRTDFEKGTLEHRKGLEISKFSALAAEQLLRKAGMPTDGLQFLFGL